MGHRRTLALGLGLTLMAGAALHAGEAKQLADWELKMLEKAAEKFQIPAETKTAMRKVIEKYAATRKQKLAKLATDLKALEVASGVDEARAGELLAALDEDRKAMRAMRVAKRDELGSFFTDTQKLRIVAKMRDHHGKRRHKPGKVAKFMRKHVPTFMTKILGVEQVAVDAMVETFKSRKGVRQALKSEWKELSGKIDAHIAQENPDEETSRLLVIQARQLRKKAHAAVDQGLEAFRGKLSNVQRADMVGKIAWGVRKLAGFVGHFVEVEELKLFQ